MSDTRPEPGWIARYFIDPPDPKRLDAARTQLAFGAAGAVLGLVLLIAESGGIAFLGFLLLVFCGIFGIRGAKQKKIYDAEYARAIPRPSDEEIDQIIGMDTLSIVNRALPQLGLTQADLVSPRGMGGSSGGTFDDLAASTAMPKANRPGASQMVVWGPALPCNLAIGEDGKLRYSKYEFMVICPTNYHLAVYRCELDLYTGALRSERTYEFHYSDVVAVRTLSFPVNRFQGIPIHPRPSQWQVSTRLDTIRTMEIVVSSGDRAAITLGVSNAAELTVDSGETNDSLQFRDVLDRIRQMLREKKGGTERSSDSDLF